MNLIKQWGFTWLIEPQTYEMNDWEMNFGYPALCRLSQSDVTIYAYADPKGEQELAALKSYPNREKYDYICESGTCCFNAERYQKDIDTLTSLAHAGCTLVRERTARACYLVLSDKLSIPIFENVVSQIKKIEASPMSEPAGESQDGFFSYKENYYVSLRDFFKKHPGYTVAYEPLTDSSDIVAVFGYIPVNADEEVIWNRNNAGWPYLARFVNDKIKEV